MQTLWAKALLKDTSYMVRLIEVENNVDLGNNHSTRVSSWVVVVYAPNYWVKDTWVYDTKLKATRKYDRLTK